LSIRFGHGLAHNTTGRARKQVACCAALPLDCAAVVFSACEPLRRTAALCPRGRASLLPLGLLSLLLGLFASRGRFAPKQPIETYIENVGDITKPVERQVDRCHGKILSRLGR
jgi:hypothetical protein